MSFHDEKELDALLDAEEVALWSTVGDNYGGDDGWGEDADDEFHMGPCEREARLQQGDWCWNDFSSDDEDVLGAATVAPATVYSPTVKVNI